jgi:WD40 repeat protein
MHAALPRLIVPLAAALLLAAGPARAAEFEKKSSEILFGAGAVYPVAFSPDGKRIAAGTDRGSLKVWDIEGRKFVADLKGLEDSLLWAVAFSPDGKFLASGASDNTARVWDVATSKELAKIDTFGDRVTGVAFSPDGKTLAACSNDGTAVLFDLGAKKLKFSLKKHTDAVRGVAFAPDGKSVATAGKDKQVLVWNAETGKPRLGVTFGEILYSCAFTPDGKQLMVAGGEEFRGKDNSIKVIDLEKKGQPALLKGHTSSIWSLSLTADGKTLASSGYHDQTARLWDVEGKSSKGVLKAGDDVRNVAISPDGKTLAVVSGTGVTLWSVK